MTAPQQPRRSRRTARRLVVTGALIGLPLMAVTGTAMADPVHHDGDRGQYQQGDHHDGDRDNGWNQHHDRNQNNWNPGNWNQGNDWQPPNPQFPAPAFGS
ncbi:hypothetical protein [Rhodococcus kronopolitis]|uniref:Uncharacterized protein n=1 Tax=Rhodococcus kronopolitis TaxID=1460226 RepID=A0ABV9FZ80_9NOCA